jgi:DNA repair exonuclease SbcCD ATPase subunit
MSRQHSGSEILQNEVKTTTGSQQKPAQLAALLESQQAIKKLQGLIRASDTAMMEWETKLAGVRDAMPSTDALEAELQRLFADEALGRVSTAERAKREQELEAELAKVRRRIAEAGQSVSRIELALSGLRKQRAADGAALQQARERRQELLAEFLLAEAERVGREYLEHAERLRDLFGQVLALDELHQRAAGDGRSIRGVTCSRIFVPSFNLSVHQAADHPNWPGALFRGDVMTESCLTKARGAERERLAAMGVEGL